MPVRFTPDKPVSKVRFTPDSVRPDAVAVQEQVQPQPQPLDINRLRQLEAQQGRDADVAWLGNTGQGERGTIQAYEPKRGISDIFLGKEEDRLPESATPEAYFRKYVASPIARAGIGLGRGVLLDTPSIGWAVLQKYYGGNLPEPIRGKSLDEAINWAANENPTAFNSFVQDTASFVGAVRSAGGVGAGLMQAARNPSTAIKIGREALKFAVPEAGKQISRGIAETVNPTVDAGYGGGLAVAESGLMGGAFSALGQGVNRFLLTDTGKRIAARFPRIADMLMESPANLEEANRAILGKGMQSVKSAIDDIKINASKVPLDKRGGLHQTIANEVESIPGMQGVSDNAKRAIIDDILGNYNKEAVEKAYESIRYAAANDLLKPDVQLVIKNALREKAGNVKQDIVTRTKPSQPSFTQLPEGQTPFPRTPVQSTTPNYPALPQKATNEATYLTYPRQSVKPDTSIPARGEFVRTPDGIIYPDGRRLITPITPEIKGQTAAVNAIDKIAQRAATGNKTAEKQAEQLIKKYPELRNRYEATLYDNLVNLANSNNKFAINRLNDMQQGLTLPTYDELMQRAEQGDQSALQQLSEGNYFQPTVKPAAQPAPVQPKAIAPIPQVSQEVKPIVVQPAKPQAKMPKTPVSVFTPDEVSALQSRGYSKVQIMKMPVEQGRGILSQENAISKETQNSNKQSMEAEIVSNRDNPSKTQINNDSVTRTEPGEDIISRIKSAKTYDEMLAIDSLFVQLRPYISKAEIKEYEDEFFRTNDRVNKNKVSPLAQQQTPSAPPKEVQGEKGVDTQDGNTDILGMQEVDNILKNTALNFGQKADAIKKLGLSPEETGKAIMAIPEDVASSQSMGGGKKSKLQSALEKYENGEIESISDFVNTISNIKNLPEKVEKAIQDYNKATSEDRVKYGMRSGLENDSEEALIRAIKTNTLSSPSSDAGAGKPAPVGKVSATSVPEEWKQTKILYDWGNKGLRAKGNAKLAGRKTFVWQGEFDKIPVRLEDNRPLKLASALSDEVWKVQTKKGEDYYLVPKQITKQIIDKYGIDSIKNQKPKPVRSPLQQVYDFINSSKRRKDLPDFAIGEGIDVVLKQNGIPENRLSPSAKKYLDAYRNASKEEIDAFNKFIGVYEDVNDSQIISEGMEQEIQSAKSKSEPDADYERLEREAIQQEEYAGEIGDFLDFGPKKDVDLTGRAELKGGASGKQKEAFDLEQYKTIKEQEKIISKDDAVGQMDFFGGVKKAEEKPLPAKPKAKDATGNLFGDTPPPRSRQSGFVDFGGAVDTAEAAKEIIGEATTKAIKGVKFAVRDIAGRMKSIAPELAQRLENNQIDKILRPAIVNKQIEGYWRGRGRLSKAQAKAWNIAWNKNDIATLERIANSNGFIDDFRNIRLLMDVYHDRSIDSGLNVPHRNDYLPREVKDVNKLRDLMYGAGRPTNIEIEIRKKEKELGRSLTEQEKEDSMANMLRGLPSEKIYVGKPGHAKKRRIEDWQESYQKFYKNDIDVLKNYIIRMESAIADAEFFGKVSPEYSKLKRSEAYYRNQISKTQDANKLRELQDKLRDILAEQRNSGFDTHDNTIGEIVNKLVSDGKIKPGQDAELRDMMQAYFNPKKQGSISRAISNLTYTLTLGNDLTHNLTQLSEIGYGLLKDPKSFIPNMVKAFLRKSEIDLKKSGIDIIAEELRHKNIYHLTTSLLKLTMFSDRYGKEILMGTSIDRARRLAGMNNPPADFVDELKLQFGDEYQDVMDDLRNNRKSENVIRLALHELMKRQPIGSTGMTEGQLRAGNLKPLYDLRSFGLKQLNGIYEQLKDDFRNAAKIQDPVKRRKKYVEGVIYAALTIAIIDALSAGIDATKDFIKGKELKEPSEYMTDNLLSLFMMSKYWFNSFSKNPPSKAVGNVIPATGVADRLYYAVKKEDPGEIKRWTPLIGGLWDAWTKEKEISGKPERPQRPKRPERPRRPERPK